MSWNGKWAGVELAIFLMIQIQQKYTLLYDKCNKKWKIHKFTKYLSTKMQKELYHCMFIYIGFAHKYQQWKIWHKPRHPAAGLTSRHFRRVIWEVSVAALDFFKERFHISKLSGGIWERDGWKLCCSMTNEGLIGAMHSHSKWYLLLTGVPWSDFEVSSA